MKTMFFATSFAFVVAFLIVPDIALAQTKPATSGTTSFYEPEQRPHREGMYLPNVPGSPHVGARLKCPRSRWCRRQ